MISAITESWTELWNWPIKTESYVKHGILLQYLPVLDWNSGAFFWETGTFLYWENIPGSLHMHGTNCVSLPKQSSTSPNNSSLSQGSHEKLAMFKNCKTHYLPQNTGSSSFRTTFMCQVMCCIAKSVNIMLIGDVYIHAKTTYGLKPMWKMENTKLD